MEIRDVLLIESPTGAGQAERESLEAAGHRVHDCRLDGTPGFPCAALLDDGTCPLDDGIDVALLVLDGDGATPFTAGVGCAVRAGVPVVSDRPGGTGPYGPFLAAEVNGGAVAAVEAGAESARRALEDQVRLLADAVLHDCEVRGGDVSLRRLRSGDTLRFVLEGPELDGQLERALCVRAFDAIRGHEGAASVVDIAYQVR